jgi:signal transduction histidine kinase
VKAIRPVRTFAVVSGLCIAGLCLPLGLAISSLLERHIAQSEWVNTAELATYELQEHDLAAHWNDPEFRRNPARYRDAFKGLLSLPEVVRITVWDRDATVLWADDSRLIGSRFPDNADVMRALGGQLAVTLKTLRKPEQAHERERFPRLAEIYVPVRARPSGEILGAIEVYKLPERLFAAIRRTQMVVWSIVLAGGGLLYVALLPVVRRVHRTQLDLEARLRDHASGLEAIHAVTEEITRELDLGTVLNLITRRAAALVGAVSGAVFLWDEAAQVLIPRAWTGYGEWMREVRLGSGEGIAGTVAERRQGMIINDYRSSPYASRLFLDQTAIRATVAEPLLYADRLVGVITVNDEGTGRPFTERDRKGLALFAGQAAIAIENARLYAEAVAKTRRLEGLIRTSANLVGTLRVEEVLQAIAEEGAKLLQVEGAGFRLLEGDQLVVGGKHGLAHHVMLKPSLRVGESLSGLVVQTGRPILVPDLREDRSYLSEHKVAAERHGVVAFLGAPLRCRDRIIGVLNVYGKTRRAFDEGEVNLLSAFADQAAIAIENARLFDATQAQASALREKNAELDSFVYVVSHDLKAPLITIQGMSTILLEDYGAKLEGEGRHYLQRIQANTQQMERLIQDLLALSRVGREGRAPELVHLPELVDDLLLGLADKIRARGISVIRRDQGTLRAIRSQLEQVFGNLLSNAVKYLGDSPAPAVEIGVADRGGFMEGYVKDNGIGIAPAYHAQVFEVFQRLKEIEAEGTGVGLAIVKKIIDAAGGRVWVESEKGQGATFRFTWPKASPQQSPGINAPVKDVEVREEPPGNHGGPSPGHSPEAASIMQGDGQLAVQGLHRGADCLMR